MHTKCENCPLRKLKLFKDMTPEELSFTRNFKVGELAVKANTPILSEGANAPQVFTALKGMGLRYKILENGNRQVIGFVLPGDFIGLQAGVMNEMTHSVEATTDMLLCVFDRSELWTLFRESPARAFDLTWIAANEERFLGEALTSLGQRSAIQRLAWALARFWRRMEASDMIKGSRAPLPYRQQDLADALGLSLVHTNKTLAKLRDRQIATWSDSVLSVPNIEKLETLGLCASEKVHVRPFI